MFRICVALSFFLTTTCAAQQTDIEWLKAINGKATPSGVTTWRFITDSEPYVAIGSPVIALSTSLITHNRDQRWKAYSMTCAPIAASLITTGLKFGVDRERPFVSYPNDITKYTKAGSKSFPSGHTSSAFCTATILSLEYPKWYVIVPAYAYACAIGYSRMYLGVHYPSDVLGGALIGTGTAIGTHYLIQYWKKKRDQRSQPIE